MNKIVVIVEDTESVASALAMAIENIPGVRAVVAENSRAALGFFTASNGSVAAVVTDLHLPYLDGFELIREIRKLAAYRTLPAIMITADEGVDLGNGTAAERPNAIFQKPFSLKEVCRVLEELLQ
ncbi:MAG: response regulator [Bryobacteraceae bacterium]